MNKDLFIQYLQGGVYYLRCQEFLRGLEKLENKFFELELEYRSGLFYFCQLYGGVGFDFGRVFCDLGNICLKYILLSNVGDVYSFVVMIRQIL